MEEIEVIDENTRLIWESAAGNSVVSARDFVYLEQVRPTENGFGVFQTSIEHASKPPAKDPVRGEIFFRVFELVNTPEGCQFTMLGCVHPRGSVFKMVAGKAAGMAKTLANKLRQLVLAA